tara:strand:+ start:368 stop:559 length:192 start_codon:yes stop_codon:yes gene_type:complete
MNNTLKILKSNFEHAESDYYELRIAVINAIDELHQYRNGFVTDDGLISTLTELLEELLHHKNK